MLWLTWRQHRAEVLGALLLLAALGAVLVVTGLPMHAAYADQGVAACVAGDGPAGDCDMLLAQFAGRYVGLGDLLTLLVVLPALAGVFIGAPLLGRELEHGTWRLAWAQGVTRTRWLAVKLALLTVAVTVLAVGFTALFTWWRGPLDGLQGRFDGAAYNFEGAVPTAAALFAFALGTLAGTLARRTIPAMALAFFGYWVVWLPLVLVGRPRFLAPLVRTSDADAATATTNAGRGALGAGQDWILDSGLLDRAGHRLSFAQESAVLRAARDADISKTAYLQQHGIRTLEVYQPGDRFWTFQLIEAGLLVALAAVLLAIAVWLVHRRTG
ncbi:MAG TPA: transporter [Actinomycetes bacterium]|nr:transporter [Actinomycetes bacterium]